MTILKYGEFAVQKARQLGADEAEAFLTQGQEISVKAEANELKLATTHVRDGVGIRVFSDRALGFASVNAFDEQKIEEAVRAAVSLSKASLKDEHNLLPEPQHIKDVGGLYDQQAERFQVDAAISMAGELLSTARGYDPRVMVDSASFNATIETRAIVNSRGIKAEERANLFSYFIMGMARDGEEVSSFNYRFDATRKAGEIAVKEKAREFAEGVVASLGASKGESFVGTVILSPNAVLELVIEPLTFAIDANRVQKGMSGWAGMLDKQVASPLLAIEDDGRLEGGTGSASFDREGLPHTHLKLVEDGILRAYLHNSYTAAKEGRRSSGHASGGARSVPAIGPTNLLVRPGHKSKEELIDGVKRGILVTRFSGFPEPVSGEFSGVVKGGFLIENGRLTRPLIETLVSGNLFEMLPRVSGLSRETERLGAVVAPYMMVEDMAITGG
ncbi:MAG: TldD/PmbA family protein [Dehalococcoidia bacterium]|nr:TldD/PmbA family protein [Dehalococcoidia bacterium]